MKPMWWRNLLLCLALVASCTTLFGNNAWADDGSFGTGLKEPTAAQLEWMNQNFPVIQTIRLNQVAFDRINADREAKGMAPLPASQMNLAPVGKEAVFAPGRRDVETTAVSAGLPASVDNSASAYFPPIGDQGSIGSCVAWATTYYQLSYETNLALNRTISPGDYNYVFSPKWTYNMINDGVDGGSYFSDAYNLELRNGAATYAQFPYDTNYRAWDMVPSDWNTAISYRPQTTGSLYNSNVDTMINDIKAYLADGHIMVIGTYVYSWVMARVSDDPSTPADNQFVGQYIASYEKNTHSGGHGMTIVGYNDDIWCDLNGNGVVDPGEKGAFKIANSWGDYWNHGFVWISYDSLRATSAVSGWSSNRSSSGIFYSGSVWTLTVEPYTPTMKAEVTLNQAKRGQVAVTLGVGSTSSTGPTRTWSSAAVYNSGGNYAFDGTTTAVDGTFFFDFGDLTAYADPGGINRWFIGIRDSTSGAATTIQSFKLYDGDTLVAEASGLPRMVDGGQVYIWVDYTFGTQITHNLTMAVSGNGSTTPSVGDHTYAEGTVADIIATPDTGWQFANWTGDVVDPNSASTTVTMDADKTVTANFIQLTTYNLTMAVSGNGATSPAVGVHTYSEGTVVDITAAGHPGWTFAGWSGDLSGSSNPESITMDADKSVTATFTQDQYTLTVNVVGNGSVARDPDQATYTYGTIVALTPVADPGWTFVGWSGDLSGSSSPESIAMDAGKSVTASFAEIAPYVDQLANGEVSVYGSVSGSYIDTYIDDGVAESITEITTGGRPQNRQSYLDHEWTFDVEAGETVTLYANAWAPVSSDGDNFAFSYSIDDLSFDGLFSIFSGSDNSNYQSASLDLPGSFTGTVYVRVQDTVQEPGNNSKDTLYIDQMFIRTNNEPPVPPAAPSALTATASSSIQIDLGWTDNADNELGFHIQRSPDGTANWTEVGEVGPNVDNYSDTGLAPGTTYSYRVQAHNSAGTSGYSNTVSATTDEGNSVHVGDLDGASSPGSKNRWNATVTVTILDAGGNAVSGATVTGVWSDGANGSSTATTNADGLCQVAKNNIKSNVSSATFTITNVQYGSDIYDSSSNGDQDGDSNGTIIIVPQ